MARSRKELDRLATELAALSAEERAQVLAMASRREHPRPPPANFEPPSLKGGVWLAEICAAKNSTARKMRV